jgi:putative cardiolipin synthase
MKNLKILSILFLFTLSFSGLAQTQPEESTEKPPYRETSTVPHDMKIINSGSAALYARLEMIRNAKTSIELETFIFNKDTSGRLVMKELVAAAKRGVKVRILVDKATINVKLNEYDAQLLKENGVDLRFYNNSSVLNLSTVQYRNHRKLLVVDDNEVISGGRNIADEYFDLNKRFNFLDRDAEVKGPIVKTMRESFDLFWNSTMTEIPNPIKIPEAYHPSVEDGDSKYQHELSEYNKKTAEAKAMLAPNSSDDKKLNFIMTVGKKKYEEIKQYPCPEMSFASDREGAGFLASLNDRYQQRYRLLKKEISKWMKNKITSELTIDTPYFLNNNFTADISKQLSKKIKVNVLTNSVSSTDAIHVASVFNDSINQFTPNENFNAYTFKGKIPEEVGEVFDNEIKNATWGTHSKTMVFNEDSFMIGTYNMDNRSSTYNTELALFCTGSKPLTDDILNSIKNRISKSNKLNTEGVPDDCSSLLGDEATTSKKLFYYLLKVPSYLLQSLL